MAQALAPAGSGATPVSVTVKGSWYPGERGIVSMTMQNTGTVDWTAPQFALTTQDGAWGWNLVRVASTVQSGSSQVFTFMVAAPNSPGVNSFNAVMQALGAGAFGNAVNVPVTISAASSRPRGCTLVPGSSSIPTSMSPGESRAVTVTVQNSGTDPWAANFALNSVDVPRTLWNQTTVLAGNVVAPGANKTFTFSIRAPSAPGTHRFAREMLDPSFGNFQASNFCVDVPITVTAGSSPDGATVASHNFPPVMAPGETTTVVVNMTNTGSATWAADGSVVLYSRTNPVTLWGTTLVPLRSPTAPSATATFAWNVTAPLTPGTYSQAWSMRRLSGANAALFGETVNVPVVVSASQTPRYGATVSSITVPSPLVPGGTYPLSIVMKNSGSQPWEGSAFALRSTTSPTILWGVAAVALPAATIVAPGAEHTFSFSVKAPADVSVPSTWRMSQLNGIGNFGQTATASTTPQDCAQQLSNNPSSANGVYRIDVDGGGPTAPFDVYCDMTNGGWTQVNDQDVTVGGGFQSIGTWLQGVNVTAPNGGQWGVLNHLGSFGRTAGGFELRLTYGQDESMFATWVQANSPLTGDSGAITGLSMTPANQVGCGGFSGLIRDAGNAALDGNLGGCWWFAVGSQSEFGGGIPAFEGSDVGGLVTDRIRLYVRR